MNVDNISLEPLANEGNAEGQGILVTSVSEIGACSNRTAETIVSASATQIIIGVGKTSIEFQNTGNKMIYYGGSGVDSTSGIRILPSGYKIFTNVKRTFTIYFICAAGETSTLRIGEYT